MSSHYLGELERICDHIGIIHEGKILLEDSIWFLVLILGGILGYIGAHFSIKLNKSKE